MLPQNRKVRLQLGVAFLLLAFPLSMIFINGKDTLQAILWKKEKEASAEVEASPDSPVAKPSENGLPPNMLYGVYDPGNQFATETAFDLEHIYISWADFNDSILLADLNSIAQAGRKVLLTIEPWPKEDESDVLTDITQGDYDEKLWRIAEVLNVLEDTMIYISWGHEMDQDLTERYAWSGKSPELFVSAYQYVFNFMESAVTKNIRWVWAPVVKKGSLNYWPGDAYVDLVGLPIYSFPDFDRDYYGHIRSFATTMSEKYSMLDEIDKPILIVELGVAGSGDFKTYWLSEAFSQMGQFPKVAGLIYFQSQDTPGAWGEELSTPDWRLDPAFLKGLVDWYQDQGE
jgi:beta-mannanase